MIWEYLREGEFENAVKASKGLCIVPVGCLEKHGQHSPVGTDTIIAENVAVQASEIEPAVVFPTMYFGEKSGASQFKGTVIFSIETRWLMFKETCNEIYRNGFKKILFCNGHGGNSDMLGLFSRRMLEENPNILIYTTSVCSFKTLEITEAIQNNPEKYSYLTEEDKASLIDFVEKKKTSGHACIRETAMAYHFQPDSVRLDKISQESGDNVRRFTALSNSKVTSPMAWMADFPNSYSGSNDYVMNERIARAISEYDIDLFAKKIHFLKEETISEEYQKEWIAKQSK